VATKNLTLTQGKTFSLTLRWESRPVKYKAITGISKTAPAIVTAPLHGVPDGWRGAISGVKGMTEINVEDPNDIRDDEYRIATVIDANTLELNSVNACDFRAYTSGGYFQYYTPVDLTGFSARMSIRHTARQSVLLECTVGGTSGDVKPTAAGVDGGVTWDSATTGTPYKEWLPGNVYAPGDVVDLSDLIRLTSSNGRITLDPARSTIALEISAPDTALLAWQSGVYDLELVSPAVVPVVTALLSGAVTVLKEATTS
jgi:hypothetical protein